MRRTDSPCQRAAVLIGMLSMVTGGCTSVEPTPPEPVRPLHAIGPAPSYKAVPGAEQAMREATIHIEKLAQLGGRLEIRTVILRPHIETILPVNTDVVLEVRGGAVETTIGESRKTYYPGDIWLVSPGSRVVLNGITQAVVLRAIYLVREP